MSKSVFAVRVGDQGGDLGDGRGRFGLVGLFVVVDLSKLGVPLGGEWQIR